MSRPTGRTRPRCRYCGVIVPTFGSICADCDGSNDLEHHPDALLALTRDDLARLNERMDTL